MDVLPSPKRSSRSAEPVEEFAGRVPCARWLSLSDAAFAGVWL
jgi:hypothetical protein